MRREWLRAIRAVTDPLRRRILLMVSRAIVRVVDDSGGLQVVQVTALAGEVLDGVTRVQVYGLTSHPHSEAEGVLVCVGGTRSHGLLVTVDDRRYRPRGLAAGEVCLYTDEGDRIHLRRGRIIAVTAGAKVQVTAPEVEVVADTKVALTSPLVEVSGNLTVGGTAAVAGALSAAAVTAGGIGLATHKHGGVQTGAGQTGVPVP
ncbi:MAG TPA: phage baseplate assembly protein V [Thermodesulfobacteriota bacterium]